MTEPDKKYEEVLESFTAYQKTAEKEQAENRKSLATETLQLEKTAREQSEEVERTSAETKRKNDVSR